jgi:hypothetical protein
MHYFQFPEYIASLEIADAGSGQAPDVAAQADRLTGCRGGQPLAAPAKEDPDEVGVKLCGLA